MRIELTKTEFECLWQHCPSFKERIYDKLSGEDLTQDKPYTIDDLASQVRGKFGKDKKKIQAIKFCRDYALENIGFPKEFVSTSGKKLDITSLLGAKTFVEDFCFRC